MASPATALSTAEATPTGLARSGGGGRRRSRRKTVDPADFEALLRDEDESSPEDKENARRRRETLDPRDLSGLFSGGRGSAFRASVSCAKPSSQSAAASAVGQPRTPPTPPATANKTVKSILRTANNNQDRMVAPRSVTFGRKRSVLSFDNTLPVTSLTPANRLPIAHQEESASTTPLGRIGEEESPDNGRDTGASAASADSSKLFRSIAQPQWDKQASPVDKGDNGDHTMDIPFLGDFSGSGSAVKHQPHREPRATIAIPSMMDFLVEDDTATANDAHDASPRRGNAYDECEEGTPKVNVKRPRATLDVPGLLDFMEEVDDDGNRTEAGETMGAPSLSSLVQETSYSAERETSVEETMAVPSVRQFVEDVGPEAQTKEEPHAFRPARAPRETMDIPALMDFAETTIEQISAQNQERRPARETLAVPNLMDFVEEAPSRTSLGDDDDDEEHGVEEGTQFNKARHAHRKTLDVPNMFDFLGSDTTFGNINQKSDSKVRGSSAGSNYGKLKTLGEALEELFPGFKSLSTVLSETSNGQKNDLGSALKDDLSDLTADALADALINVHKESCALFCEEQLSNIAQDRLRGLPSDVQRLPLPRDTTDATLDQLASSARAEAEVELLGWLADVRSLYVEGIQQQASRVDEDLEALDVQLGVWRGKRASADAILNKRQRIDDMQSKLEALEEERKSLAAEWDHLQEQLERSRRSESEKQQTLEAVQRRVDTLSSATGSALEAFRRDVNAAEARLRIQQALSLWTLERAAAEYAVLNFGLFKLQIRLEGTRATMSLDGKHPTCLSGLFQGVMDQPMTIHEVTKLLCELECTLYRNAQETRPISPVKTSSLVDVDCSSM